MEAERFVVKRKQCWFMKDRVGQTFEGIVSGLTARGAFVELVEFGLEGFVPLDYMDGHYEYDERHRCLRKRPGHDTRSVGDSIRIIVEKVSVDDGEITFAETERR